MAPTKKTALPSKARSSISSSKVSLAKVKGENFYRNAKQVARLKMLNGGKAIRDKDGNIIQAAAFQKGEDETKPGRVQPDRRWFGAYLALDVQLRLNAKVVQETHGSSRRLLSITSERVLMQRKMILTLCYCEGINCLWPC